MKNTDKKEINPEELEKVTGGSAFIDTAYNDNDKDMFEGNEPQPGSAAYKTPRKV